MTLQLKTWADDANHAVGTLGPLVVQVWRGKKTFHNWREESTLAFATADRAHPAGYCVLIVIEDSAEMPDPGARQDVNNLARERQHRIVGSAVLVEGSGVRTTMVRSLMTAVNMFSRNSMKPFSQVDDAILWLAQAAHEKRLEFDSAATREFLRALRHR